MILPVVQYDDPRLRQKGVKIEGLPDAAIEKLSQDMLETMYAAKGIGLAAQQVGHALQLCVIDVQAKPDEVDFAYTLDGKTPPLGLIMPLVLINPVVKLKKSTTEWYDEGCLSFPGIRADVERPSTLEVKYVDVQGHPHVLACDGLLSRVIQHEVDHLNGTLFIDRMPKSTVKKLWPELEKLKIKKIV